MYSVDRLCQQYFHEQILACTQSTNFGRVTTCHYFLFSLFFFSSSKNARRTTIFANQEYVCKFPCLHGKVNFCLLIIHCNINKEMMTPGTLPNKSKKAQLSQAIRKRLGLYSSCFGIVNRVLNSGSSILRRRCPRLYWFEPGGKMLTEQNLLNVRMCHILHSVINLNKYMCQ